MNRQLACIVVATVVFGVSSSGAAAELAHRWSFNGSLTDSVGGKDATIVDVGPNDAVLSDTEVTMTGGPRDSSDYVVLQSHILTSLGDMTSLGDPDLGAELVSRLCLRHEHCRAYVHELDHGHRSEQ